MQAKPHDTHDLCVLLNNDLAKMVGSNPKRFVGLGTLPMQAPDLAILEMTRCKKDLGFPGVQIGSHINSWNLNAPELFPFYAVRSFHSYSLECVFLHAFPTASVPKLWDSRPTCGLVSTSHDQYTSQTGFRRREVQLGLSKLPTQTYPFPSIKALKVLKIYTMKFAFEYLSVFY